MQTPPGVDAQSRTRFHLSPRTVWASALITVSALAVPGLLIAIQGIAVIGAK